VDGDAPDRVERIDAADRWLGDTFRVLEPPGGFATVEVDMTSAKALCERLRAAGTRITYTHLIVRAAALAFARHPELKLMVAGYRRLRSQRVDVGLSVASSGESVLAPIMLLEDAGQKPLPALAEEITRRVPEVREREARDLASLRRYGRFIPFGGLRRRILRFLLTRLWFRRRIAGLVQVTCTSEADVNVPFLFTATAALGAGRVRDRVVAVNGQPAVRPILILSCAADHKAWDGRRGYLLMSEVKRILEEGQLDGEAGGLVVSDGPRDGEDGRG
jgi:pyruvate dehydrogenase E2 component (dihydrolipoamide acetyltransferase)